MGAPFLPPYLILVAVGLYGLVHSWLASLQAKTLARSHLGPKAERLYRLMYNVFAVISLLPLLWLAAALPDRHLYSVPFPWMLLTLAIQALAALTVLIGVLQTGIWAFLGLEQAASPGAERPSPLVAGGLYRWVRHPLYTAALVFIWLTPVMTVNLLVLFLGFSAYLVIGAYFEERKLEREFGQAYRDYREQTPMFIPRLF